MVPRYGGLYLSKLQLIEERNPDLVAIFGGDHIFLMNVDHMKAYTVSKDADACIACIPVPIGEASRFGVVEIDEDWRIIGFQEKPQTLAPYQVKSTSH